MVVNSHGIGSNHRTGRGHGTVRSRMVSGGHGNTGDRARNPLARSDHGDGADGRSRERKPAICVAASAHRMTRGHGHGRVVGHASRRRRDRSWLTRVRVASLWHRALSWMGRRVHGRLMAGVLHQTANVLRLVGNAVGAGARVGGLAHRSSSSQHLLAGRPAVAALLGQNLPFHSVLRHARGENVLGRRDPLGREGGWLLLVGVGGSSSSRGLADWADIGRAGRRQGRGDTRRAHCRVQPFRERFYPRVTRRICVRKWKSRGLRGGGAAVFQLEIELPENEPLEVEVQLWQERWPI